MVTNSSRSAELCSENGERAWFCIRTRVKREHIAAAHLRQIPEVEVFNPQLRLSRSTRRGPRWSTESLFPNYLFARFARGSMLEKVSCTPSVKFVLRFGGWMAEIPDAVIADLKRRLTELSFQELTDAPGEGEEVEIAAGAFVGMKARVTRVLPAKQRVRILLDILGRTVPAELSLDSVIFKRRNGAQIVLSRSESAFGAMDEVDRPILPSEPLPLGEPRPAFLGA